MNVNLLPPIFSVVLLRFTNKVIEDIEEARKNNVILLLETQTVVTTGNPTVLSYRGLTLRMREERMVGSASRTVRLQRK